MRAGVLIVALVLSGCTAASISKAQFDRLRLGMTPAEVEDILGKGNAIESGEVDRLMKESVASAGAEGGPAAKPIEYDDLRGVRWGSGKKQITVVYRNDRLFRVFQQGL